MDVVVIGAGIVGAMAAYRLSQRGHQVAVVDRLGPCRGTSAATFSWTSAHGKTPLFYHRLSLASVALFEPLQAELETDIGWRTVQSLKPVLDPDAGEAARLDVEAKRAEGYQLAWLDGEEARQLAPLLSPAVLGASLCEAEGIVDSFRLTFAALDAARRLGAETLWGEEVTGFERQGERITSVRTTKTVLPCDVVVNAAGPDAADVAGLADVALPVQQVKGELLVTERVPRCLDLVVGEVRQTRAGNFLLGVTWEPGKNDRRSTARHLTRLAEQAVRLLPRLARVRVIRSFAGIRPVPEDEVSLLGPVASRPGFYLAVTHSGVTLAPLMAEVLADFLEDRRHPAWDDRLSPDRFARANR